MSAADHQILLDLKRTLAGSDGWIPAIPTNGKKRDCTEAPWDRMVRMFDRLSVIISGWLIDSSAFRQLPSLLPRSRAPN
jgi:hypothetical protein